jgi:hypothetical protein
MSFKKRIRELLDQHGGGASPEDIALVVKLLIEEGLTDDELREILPDIVKAVAKMRAPMPFFTGSDDKDIHGAEAELPDYEYEDEDLPEGPVEKTHLVTVTSSKESAELLPQAVPVTYPGSTKVKGYQANRLEELYPVGKGKFKKLKEMTKADIEHNVRMLEGKKKALQGRIDGWNKIAYQMDSYKVKTVDELPESVKKAI